MTYHKLREHLADLEHQQWIHWSKSLAKDIMRWQEYSDMMTIKVGMERKILSWVKNWKPYKRLNQDQKDQDREWADKILDDLPIKCPVYQCGGIMVTKERPYPNGMNEDDFPDGIAGDNQLPDLVCTNCRAIYQFKGFRKVK